MPNTFSSRFRLPFCLGTVLVTVLGCGEKPPSSEYAKTMLTVRPEILDDSLVEKFAVKFDGVDVLLDEPTITFGRDFRITGTYLIKEGALQGEYDYVTIKVGYRPIVNGKVDWSVNSTSEGVRKIIESEFSMGMLKGKRFDILRLVEAPPGDYEIRFFAFENLRGTRPFDFIPQICLIAKGRLKILPAEEKKEPAAN